MGSVRGEQEDEECFDGGGGWLGGRRFGVLRSRGGLRSRVRRVGSVFGG